MQTLAVSANVDIRAPLDEVWSLIADLDKRVRLCPLWDVVRVESLTPGPLGLGSAFRLHTRRQHQIVARESRVVEFVPGRRIVHQRANAQVARTVWSVQDCAAGTRLMYEEIFELSDDLNRDTILQPAHQAALEWLASLKLYLEWREARVTRAWRWLYDRWLIRMPTSQRRIVTMIVLMHVGMAISFIVAALVWGIALQR
ncbi:MAG: SRPBCC family protein [Chloroflexi bacterium]|nr:SRPBCC family protein [Chloroflexota bacterium]